MKKIIKAAFIIFVFTAGCTNVERIMTANPEPAKSPLEVEVYFDKSGVKCKNKEELANIIAKASTTISAVEDARNDAAKIGADLIVVRTKYLYYNDFSGPVYQATAVAYKCGSVDKENAYIRH